MQSWLTCTPFLLAIACLAATELVLSRAVRGDKRDSHDRGTFWLVWLAWNFAALSNVTVLFCCSADRGCWAANVAGLLLCFVAAGLRLVSKRTLGQFYTMTVNIREHHQLIENGPYRFVRHPLYAGFSLFFLAWPLTQPSVQGMALAECLGGIPVLVAILVRVRVEEAALELHFRETWQRYASQTARLIPWVY